MDHQPNHVLMSEAVHEFVIERRLRNLSPETIEWYAKRFGTLHRELGDPFLADLDASAVRRMIAAMMDRGVSPGTINGNLQALKSLLNWAFQEEIEIGLDPRRVRLIRQPRRVPQVLTCEQIETLLRQIGSGSFWARRDRMAVLTFIDTGCRSSELCRMDVDDIQLPVIRVTGKGDKDRLLALSLPAQREMLRYLRQRRTLFDAEAGPLFPSRSWPHRLTRSSLGVRVRRYGQAASLPLNLTPHTFRRTFASHFLRQSGSLVHLQQLLGHTDVTMSRKYAAVFDADAHEAAMSLSILNSVRLGR